MTCVKRRVGMCILVASLAMLSGVTCYIEYGPQPTACQLCTPFVPEGKCILFVDKNEQFHDTLATWEGYTQRVLKTYNCSYTLGTRLPNGDCEPTIPAQGSWCGVQGSFVAGEECSDPR